jgi:hypothetical protein
MLRKGISLCFIKEIIRHNEHFVMYKDSDFVKQ